MWPILFFTLKHKQTSLKDPLLKLSCKNILLRYHWISDIRNPKTLTHECPHLWINAYSVFRNLIHSVILLFLNTIVKIRVKYRNVQPTLCCFLFWTSFRRISTLEMWLKFFFFFNKVPSARTLLFEWNCTVLWTFGIYIITASKYTCERKAYVKRAFILKE